MLSRLKHLRVFFKDPDKKGVFKMSKEMLHYAWIKKELPTDYFRKYLYRKDIKNYQDYLTLKEYYSIIHSPKIFVPEIASILDNKLSFALSAQTYGLPIPKLLSYNLKHHFFYNNRSVFISNKHQLIAFFKDVFASSNKKPLFLKLFESQGGKGCLLLEQDNLDNQLKLHGDTILNNCYIHQETVIQHPDISVMYGGSVNTLRIDSYLDNHTKSHILSALMRFGMGTTFTDNASTGGFFVSVNLQDQTLRGKGRQDIVHGGGLFLKHPDTLTLIDGFKIPYLKEALELAKSTHYYFPTKLIGWDIAITKQGPLIIEANPMPSLHMSDVAYGGYCKHPLIKDILKDIKKT